MRFDGLSFDLIFVGAKRIKNTIKKGEAPKTKRTDIDISRFLLVLVLVLIV